MIEAKLDKFEAQFKEADDTLKNRHEREIEWEKLTRCISEFEAMSNNIRQQLLRLPAIRWKKQPER